MSPLAAAVILGDKSDVHRSRVRVLDPDTDDIHDRVNMATTRSFLKVDADERTITLELEIDTDIIQVMQYFEIFMARMMMCRRAAEFLGCRFGHRHQRDAPALREWGRPSCLVSRPARACTLAGASELPGGGRWE